MLAAIDGERRAGDKSGLVRNQESHAAGDLMGLPDAGQFEDSFEIGFR